MWEPAGAVVGAWGVGCGGHFSFLLGLSLLGSFAGGRQWRGLRGLRSCLCFWALQRVSHSGRPQEKVQLPNIDHQLGLFPVLDATDIISPFSLESYPMVFRIQSYWGRGPNWSQLISRQLP